MAAPMRAVTLVKYTRRFLDLHVSHRFLINFRQIADLPMNHEWEIDPRIQSGLKQEKFKHKRHPGILTAKTNGLPERLKEAVQILLERYPNQHLHIEAEKLCRQLWSRHIPPESTDVQTTADKFHREIRTQFPQHEEDDIAHEERLQEKLVTKLRKHIYHWQPVQYDAFKAFQYMVGRLSLDYTVLHRVFHEILVREPSWKPRSMFDFGSGVGSSIWAANAVWSSALREHYCVDVSQDMNTLAQLLLQDGEDTKSMCYEQVYFRQFLPMASKSDYDLVVSAYSLLELPNQSDRLKTLLSLWRKTKGFLILVENGTNAGFAAINEARNFILELQEDERLNPDEVLGHVYAPCPHDDPCPRMARADGTPCSFNVQFENFPPTGKNKKAKFRSRFSYVVFRKGERDSQAVSWPRVVREPTNPSRRVHLQLCTARGELQTAVVSAKRHGRDLYWCARCTRAGDLVPARDREAGLKGAELKGAESATTAAAATDAGDDSGRGEHVCPGS